MRLIQVKARVNEDGVTEYQFVLSNSRGKRVRQPWIPFTNGQTIEEVIELLFDARNLHPKKMDRIIAG